MGIISFLQDAFGSDPRPKSFRKGEKFESYTESYFPESHYTLVERVHDFKVNSKRFIESSLKPDFKFRDKKNNKCFYIESKYRGDLFKNKVEWCKDLNQLRRYQEYNKECLVFILIGLGGTTYNPEKVFLIPLSAAKYTGLYLSLLKAYIVESHNLISSRDLWGRLTFEN